MININKILLFISSYIPLYGILVIKNIFERVSYQGKFTKINFSQIKLFNQVNDFACVFLVITAIICICVLKHNIKKSSQLESHPYKVVDISNETDKYFFNYLAIYLLPCIGLSLNNIADVAVLVMLMVIIGYIYITNEILYINPVLGVMGYNVYHVEVTNRFDSDDKSEKKIAICKRTLEVRKNDSIRLVVNDKFALCLGKTEEE